MQHAFCDIAYLKCPTESLEPSFGNPFTDDLFAFHFAYFPQQLFSSFISCRTRIPMLVLLLLIVISKFRYYLNNGGNSIQNRSLSLDKKLKLFQCNYECKFG